MADEIEVEEDRLFHLKPGDMLFAEGDEGDSAYYIRSGAIEVTRKVGSAEVVIALEQEGGIVGEMALIDNQPRSATARAVEATTLVAVPKSEFETYLENTDPVIRRLLERFVTIIRSITAEKVRLILGIR
ncbi:MAG: cyclic nucleotide-binding domain-containing protein [Rhodospirillum sp.]|nr:cyclic nucleotide-binding domain-containing protein [Rhodospirillum sp.]MCF8490829.1 cyclic nucleotide-binding domain-containing protein [Rhodospirillum sp.]MCF8501388.1 cyclic nucleotide-binding domain-containing protein [Rhodospirillum sp.]